MLFEAWDFLTTPAAFWARRRGFLHYSIAMAYRARRCSSAWSGHLENCRTEFSSFLSAFPEAKTLAILGSGLMIETPPELIPSGIEIIYLYDAVHTKEVRQKIQKSPHSEKFILQEIDLISPELPIPVDLLVSANLLSQLPLHAPSQLQGKQNRKNIQEQHIKLCQKSASNFLLYSDLKMNFRDNQGDLIQQEKTVDITANWKNNWLWNLAPAPETDKNYSIELEVSSFQSLS